MADPLRDAATSMLAWCDGSGLAPAPMVRALRSALSNDTRAESAERLAAERLKVLRSVQYRRPRPDMVAECIVCGASGPINEATRKMDAEPCAPDCCLARAIGAG